MNTMNELEMFGCEKSVLDRAYKNHGYKELFIMGMMSDAQYEIECGMNGVARQSLNRAKYLLAKLFEEKISG